VRIPADELVVLSACLAGVPCTHEAAANTREWAVSLAAVGRAVLVCPEVAGGLPTPRPPAEIQGGDGTDVLEGRARVLDVDGADITAEYLLGARAAAAVAENSGARVALLKARSPSCGCEQVYNGSFSGVLRSGDGVTAAFLRRRGMVVASDEDVEGI